MQKRIADLHYRIANIRNNIQHEITKSVTDGLSPEKITIEDLGVANMLKNRRLSRQISDVGWAEIRRQLEYKSVWYGNTLVVADRFFPSSKKCSGCGNVKKTLGLGERTYVCDICGLTLDRDLNAAINLKNYCKIPVSYGKSKPLESEARNAP